MSLTLISRPSNFARVNDVNNRCSYIFSSNNYTMPNFQFWFDLYVWDPTVSGSSAYSLIGSFKLFPTDNGRCEFNPTSIYKSYLSYDYNISYTDLMDCPNSAKGFTLKAYESYSDTPLDAPSKRVDTEWAETGRGTVFYNGVQQMIPYDYTALNVYEGSNLQWVMSGTTQGKFLTDATEFRMDETDYGFLYYLTQRDTAHPFPNRMRITYYYYTTESFSITTIEIDKLIGMGNDFRTDTSNSQSSPTIKSVKTNVDTEKKLK